MDKVDQIINLATMFVGPSATKGDNLLTAMVKPGLQITKDAGKLTKIGQVGTQVALPAVMNEASRVLSDQEGIFGDYSDKPEKQIDTITLSPRKNSSSENIYDIEVDQNKPIRDTSDKIKSVGKVLGGITPRNCFKLMGFEFEDSEKLTETGFSNSSQYIMAGDSVCVPVLEGIFDNLFNKNYDFSGFKFIKLN